MTAAGGPGAPPPLELGGERLAWSEGWAETPAPEEATHGWAHHGLSLLADGRIVGFHPERADLLVYEPSGACVSSFATGLVEGHGITVVEEGGGERIWIADPGAKMRRGEDGEYRAASAPPATSAPPAPSGSQPSGSQPWGGQPWGSQPWGGQVVQFSLAGDVTRRLERPAHPAYDGGCYRPTSVAVDETRFGGSGEIWVADGYGESLVHRFAADGAYLASLDGTEGPGGRLSCPHGIFVDRRRGDPELFVADRGNAVVRVYGLDGAWRRDAGRGFLDSPSAFAAWGERTVVAELRARLAVLDRDEALVGYLGENGEICDSPGWPNSLDPAGHAVRRSDLAPGRFNSPHGLATDGAGNVYVAEWLVGGRMVKLEPLPAG
ncbi:MAG TPA: hypothetical protein VMD59_09595 [Acidimicrobiales bacterium]|nr:hypothetical protein [Acidimicrobiales bacterium]